VISFASSINDRLPRLILIVRCPGQTMLYGGFAGGMSITSFEVFFPSMAITLSHQVIFIQLSHHANRDWLELISGFDRVEGLR